MVTVGALAEQIGPLVDLYGQHDHQSLLKPAAQRSVLDSFAGQELANASAHYREAFATHREATQALERLNEVACDATQQREQAIYIAKEIDAVNPQEEEYQCLEEQLPRLRHANSLAEAVREALSALRDEEGACDSLSRAQLSLTRLRGIDARLDVFASTLDELTITANELTSELRAYADTLDFNPDSLNTVQERLAALDGLTRRFGPRIADVFAARAAAEATLNDTNDLEGQIVQATLDEQKTGQALKQAAADLSELRSQAAALFSAKLTQTTRDLAMPDAVFIVELTALPREAWTLAGAENVEIYYSPAAGQAPRPLAKIASGGELSRVMLAIKSLGHEEHSGMTLVFDEIDAGIGGTVARAVAAKLRHLAKHHQVLVVTHLPQIAAVANDHWVVVKQEREGQIESSICKVSGEERVCEIARMLAGSVDELSRNHAIKLLSEQK